MPKQMTRRLADGWPQIDIRDEVRKWGKATFAGDAVELKGPGLSQRVSIARVPRPHFGGERVYFICPVCERRADILYLARDRLACRVCRRLHYHSQSITSVQRRVGRILAMRERLGQPPGLSIVAPYPGKPKWMRWPTYERLIAKIAAAERRHWHASKATMPERLLARIRVLSDGGRR